MNTFKIPVLSSLPDSPTDAMWDTFSNTMEWSRGAVVVD